MYKSSLRGLAHYGYVIEWHSNPSTVFFFWIEPLAVVALVTLVVLDG